MRLNRTKVLVISLVVITLALGGAALYIANRLQTQIQTPSSAAIAPLDVVQINKTACATGTKGQNGCDYIGSKGLQDAIDDAKAEPVTLPLKSAKLTLTVKAGSYDFANSALVITDGPNKLDVDIVGESGTIFLGKKTGTEEELFPVSYFDNNGDFINLANAKSVIYIASAKAATVNVNNIMLDGSQFRITKESIANLTNLKIKSFIFAGVLGKAKANITIKNTLIYNSVANGEGIKLQANSKLNISNSIITDTTLGLALFNSASLEGTGNIITKNHKTLTGLLSGIKCDSTNVITNWKYNNVWGNESGDINCSKIVPTANGNISADPLFTNPATGDFTLKAGSPAINAVTNTDDSKSNMGLIFPKSDPVTVAEPTCVEMKIGKTASSLTKLNTRDQALLLASTDTLTVTYTLTNVPVGEKRLLLMYNGQNIGTEGNNSLNPFVSYNDGSNAKQNASAVASGNNVSFTYTLQYADLFKTDTTARIFAASPTETPQWATGEVPNLVKLGGIVKPGTGGAANTYSLDCLGYVKKVNIVVSNPVSVNAICKDMLVGTSLTNQAKKNTREAPLSVTAGSDIYITHTLSGLDATDRTRYLRIYNGQNKSKDDGSENHNYVSYSSNDNSYQKSTGTGTGDIKFTYKIKYSELFQVDNATFGFAQTPAETPQWASGQVPNYVKLAVPVKPFVNNVGGSFDVNCLAFIKRADATVTLVNTSNAACVGMTIGKNGGTQSARKTRDNPLLVSSGDTINITHTLSNLGATENYRTLRMYNAQNISADGNNNLNPFLSYYDSSASNVTTSRVANGSNFDFKYTFTYDQLFKADTSALVKAATPAEKPQWASAQIPNLVKVAVPVKPFGTNLLGTYDANCLGYISRVGITLASASSSSSSTGSRTSNGSSGSSASNDDLPSTDLSALNIFSLIGGAIFFLGGITIMKYRSRFENI